MNKTIVIKRHISLLAAIASLCISTIYAQNFTKEVLLPDNSSIIRTVKKNQWLTYSIGEKGKAFYLVPETGTALPYLSLDDMEIEVLDFKVFSDTVFFCGKMTRENTSDAIVGHFPIAGFPDVIVKYDTFPEVRYFDQMDVFKDGNKARIVATAYWGYFKGTMADIIHLSGDNWECRIVDPSGFSWWFGDVTVTSEHVVFTSNSVKSYMNKWLTRIWIFNKPVAPAGSIFLSSVDLREFVDSLSSGKMLVTKTIGDWFVTANPTPEGKLLMHEFGGTGYYGSTLYNGVPNFTLKDLVHIPLPNCTDVLTYSWNASATGSYIYHIPESAFDEDGPANIHYYENENINSLCLSSMPDSLFVASGHNDFSQSLRIFRYKYNNYTCAKKTIFSTLKKEYIPEEMPTNIEVIIYPHEFIQHDSIPDETNISTLCGQ